MSTSYNPVVQLRTYEEKYDKYIAENIEPIYYEKYKDVAKEDVRIAIIDKEIVGWMELAFPESALYSGFVFIYIFPRFRRCGFGMQIYREAEKSFCSVGCDWWSSFPTSEAAEKFSLAVGFDYTNTNAYMKHNGVEIPASTDGIRPCTEADYPAAPDIWSKEYADMHIRLGLPYEGTARSEEVEKEGYRQFMEDLDREFVIEDKGNLIGYGSLFKEYSGIGSIAIKREFAGRGYGTRLAAFLTNECIRHGTKFPHLYCEGGNDDALHVYKKIGYEEIIRETVAVKNPID